MDIGEFRKDDIGFSIGGNNMPEGRIGHPIHGGQPNDWLGEGPPKCGNGLTGIGHKEMGGNRVLEFGNRFTENV